MSFVSSPPHPVSFFLFFILIIPLSPTLLSLYSEDSYLLVLQIALLRIQSCHLCKYVKTTSPCQRFRRAYQSVDHGFLFPPPTPLPKTEIRSKCCFSSKLLVASFSSVIITVMNLMCIYRASEIVMLFSSTHLLTFWRRIFFFKF